jgi:hypothetical protein
MPDEQSFEDKYLDVLQNIEFGIIRVYQQHPELTDWDVWDAVGALIRCYTAETRGKSRPNIRLTNLSQLVFDSVEAMSEWRLGREQVYARDGEPLDTKMIPKTLDEIIACLKRIQKSVRRWNKEGGRQGYLTFISEFVQ